MKADNADLFDFLSQNKVIFDIPVFQRNYEWREEQCQQLFSDLLKLIDDKDEHFLGTFVYVRETTQQLGTLERVIDGQQRLTSCMLLLKAMVDSGSDHGDEITNRYLTNEYWDENQHLKLKPVERDEAAFRSVMNNSIDEYEGTSKVIENYKFFKNCISNMDCSLEELYIAMTKLSIVYIELNDNIRGENPQVIFESLNSTGVSLSPTDLVRNYLLMRLDARKQTDLYQEYWSKIESLFSSNIFTEFLRYYLICKTKSLVNRNAVYDAYKNYYTYSEFTTKMALQELYRYAQYYSALLTGNTTFPQFNRILIHINIMDKKVIYPYLMKLLEMKNTGSLSDEELIKTMKIWESYLFRRSICSLSSNGLNRLVVSLLKDKKNETPSIAVKKRLLSASFPTDSEVKEALLTLDIYGKHQGTAKLALEFLETHRSKETIDFEDAQVEHIMPQSLTNDWKIEVKNAEIVNKQYGGTLGNLTLTKYNQEMSNKLFSQKIDYYAESNISLTRELATKFKHWEQNDIIIRTKMLGDELNAILSRPNEVVDEVVYKGEYPIDIDMDVTGKKPSRLTFNSQDFATNTWHGLLQIFLECVWKYDSDSFKKLKQDPSLRRLFLSNGKVARLPKKLSNGLEFESAFGANSVLAIVAKISDLYGITKLVSYTIK